MTASVLYAVRRPLMVITDEGCQMLIESSEARDCAGLERYLQSRPANIFVHSSCCRCFTDARQLKKCKLFSDKGDCPMPTFGKLHSSSVPSDWKSMCLFCAEHVSSSGGEMNSREAMTVELKSTICKQAGISVTYWNDAEFECNTRQHNTESKCNTSESWFSVDGDDMSLFA